VTPHPQAQKTRRFSLVTEARVTSIEVDGNGRITGVNYLKDSQEYFQPADAVLLGSYLYENVRLLLLSKSKVFPDGLSNNHGQVGKHYFSHNQGGGVSALFPFNLNNWYGTPGQGIAVVVEAVFRIGRRALKHPAFIAIAAGAFAAIFRLGVPFPLIVLGAGTVGLLGSVVAPRVFAPGPAGSAGDPRPPEATVLDAMMARGELAHARPTLGRAARVVAVCLALWFAPLGLLVAVLGPGSVLVTEGLFFGKAAVVTFGGAYAVLAYVAQRAVETYGWLRPGEMLDGLGMAETTPGPLIMVVQFVGFMGAYRDPGPLSPVVAGVLGSVVTTWVTFVPCFLWIFLGAPYVERLRGNRWLRGALSSITAAVVGVILNLSVWFSVHVLFARVGEVRAGPVHLLAPEWGTLDIASLVLVAAALVAMLRFGVGMGRTLATSAALGMLWRLVA
jgi:chromate transporter